MPLKKRSHTHKAASNKKPAVSASSTRAKKASATSSTRTKKAAAKRSSAAAKSKVAGKSKKVKKKTERAAWLKKRDELTLKMFQMVYEDYQQGKFHRIL